MKFLFIPFAQPGHFWRNILVTLMVLVSLLLPFQTTTTYAAGRCQTSGPVSAAYTLTVCITAPADGATISGTRTVTATATTNGSSPGVSKLIFYLGGEYLITDYQSSYTFALPTTKFVDGSRLLEVEAIMKDGFTSQRASITLNFNNGIVQPPVNNNTFTPRRGTMPPSGQAFTLVATGDGADGATHASNVTDLIASWDPNLFLYLGDVYDEGTATEFRNWYGTSSTFYGRFRSITNPIIGNHEYNSDGSAPGYFDYWDNVPRYYSYNAGGWHFLAIDSNCGLFAPCGVGQAQYQWLVNDLSTNTSTCTIAYFHHPVYNVGPEGPTPRMNDIWALLAQYGVDIVMAGHDHNYQRWQPMNGSGVVSATGMTQFVAGAGGHGTQQFITSDSRLAVGFDTTPTAFGALRLQLNRYGAGYQYINTTGTMLDSGSIQCSGAPVDTTPPSKPSGLSATAVTPQHIQLTWDASTDNVGVTGYSIYRDGALLTTIGPGTTYNDTAVQLGTTYSYQVQARDAAGNISSLSSTVTLTTSMLLFSDGFESGNLSKWTSASGITVQQQQVSAGLYAARAASTGLPAYANYQLPQTQNELYYRLWFNIQSQGANSVYLQRFRTGANGAILGVFVSNTGKLAYRNDVTGVTTTSTTTVTSGAWHELQTRVRINGAASETEVWLDGTRINGLSKTENLGTTAFEMVQLGDSSSGRSFNVALDQVALSTQFIGSSNPPGNTPTPTPTQTPTSTPTVPPGAGQIQVFIGGVNQGNYSIGNGQFIQQGYAGVDNGPVRIVHTNGSSLIASERIVAFKNQGLSSYTEFMGLPASKLTDTFLFPWYNNVGLDSQLRFANVGTKSTTVTVKVGGDIQGTYPLQPKESIRVMYSDLDNGPVQVKSSGGTPILASMRVVLKTTPGLASYSEFIGLSGSNTSSTRYVFPRYNNVSLDSQLRFGNVGANLTTVTVRIGGVVRGTYPLASSESMRVMYSGLDLGPVEVRSSNDVPIIASMRTILKEDPTFTSYTEFMGLSEATLTDTKYVFPWYNNVGLDSQLRFANVGTSPTTVTVRIGGVEQASYPLAVNTGLRVAYNGVDQGPVEIESSGNVPILASMRIVLKNTPGLASYSELMGLSVGAPLGLPGNQLSSTYWFPWYNNVGLDSQLLFGIP